MYPNSSSQTSPFEMYLAHISTTILQDSSEDVFILGFRLHRDCINTNQSEHFTFTNTKIHMYTM